MAQNPKQSINRSPTSPVNPFPNKPWFLTCLRYKSFEIIVGKGEIARNNNFSFSQSVFYPFGELCAIFIKSEIVFCNSFSSDQSKSLSLGKDLNIGILGHIVNNTSIWQSKTNLSNVSILMYQKPFRPDTFIISHFCR